MSDGGVAVVVPAYQAAGAVAEVVRQVRAGGWPLLVVDDGSTDGTGAIARDAGAPVVAHARNRGKGAALRRGIRELLADPAVAAVVTVDADGQHVPAEIPRLLDVWRQGADLVLGTRQHLFAEMGAVRRLSNRTSTGLISLAAGRRLLDVQTGFRLYARPLLESLELRGDRFEAESWIVVRAARRGFRIVEVPVAMGRVDGRHGSHYRPLVDSLRIAGSVLHAWSTSLSDR